MSFDTLPWCALCFEGFFFLMTENRQGFLFHVLKGSERIVIFRMSADGSHTLYLPGGKPVAQVWPLYADAKPYLEAWLSGLRGQDVDGIEPGSPEYPNALARNLTKNPFISMWAYVTPVALTVSFRQIAQALGRDPTPRLRHELEESGLRFTRTESGHFQADLATVTRILGSSVADRLLLLPHQIADVLGISAGAAADVIRRLGIAIDGRDVAAAEWGKVKRIRRAGPRRFDLTGAGEAL